MEHRIRHTRSAESTYKRGLGQREEGEETEGLTYRSSRREGGKHCEREERPEEAHCGCRKRIEEAWLDGGFVQEGRAEGGHL